jgi:hypothetical protein
MSHEPKRPVTIEDLLRLKSAERPPAEFWERFDRELRAKQLAALVQKRPWWQNLPRLATGWRRYHFPLGATAVLAVTFITLRDSSPVTPAPTPGAVRQLSVAVAPATAIEVMPVAIDASKSDFVANLVSADARAHGWSVQSVQHADAPADPGLLVSSAAAESETPAELAPSARYIAANFAAARASDPVIGRGLLGAAAVDGRPQMARSPTVEPLAQMTPPGDVRRRAFISAMTVAASTDMSNRTLSNRAGERATRELSDDRMNDSIRRFNAKADRFSLKL